MTLVFQRCIVLTIMVIRYTLVQFLMQYQYRLKDNVRLELQKRKQTEAAGDGFIKLDPRGKKSLEMYCEAVRNSVANGAFEQENKYGLQMFYTSNLENVFYEKENDCYIVLEQDDETLTLQSVISPKYISLEEVICKIPVGGKEFKLGFTPRGNEADLFTASVFDGGEDYRLLYRGSKLESIEKEKLYFPEFSHA